MNTELFLDFIGIRMDSRKAEGLEFTINLVTPDNGEKFVVELSNATLDEFEIGFEIMPGTGGPAAEIDRSPYEVGPVDLQGE